MIGRHWSECRAFLESVRDAGDVVVVHCVAGINRSGAICLCGLHDLGATSVLEAIEHVKGRRGSLLWNASFQIQLCQLAAEHGVLGEKP